MIYPTELEKDRHPGPDHGSDTTTTPASTSTETSESAVPEPITLRLERGLDEKEIETVLAYTEGLDGVTHRTQAFYLHDMKQRGLHQKLGYPSAVRFAQSRLDMSPGQARDLIRVGGALEELEAIDAAFRNGEISWSKTRLLCRIGTPETEGLWLERARELSCRDLERQIRAADDGRPPRKGSKGLPAVRLAVQFMLDVLTHELWEQARRRMAAEQGEPISESELVRILCSRFLEGPAPEEPASGERVNTSLFHVVVDHCPDCRESAVRTDEGPVEIEPAVGARLAADPGTPKIELNDDDESLVMASGIDRETTPKERREILARDGYRCRCCGGHKDLTVHHIIFRSRGGRTVPRNLMATCTACHALIHEGLVVVRGTAPHGLVITDGDGRPLEGGVYPSDPGVTLVRVPEGRARARPEAESAAEAPELGFDALPGDPDRDWWNRHAHLLTWNERRKALEFEPGVPIEPATDRDATTAGSSLRFRRSDRPASLENFVGQERIVEGLKLAARAAHVRAEPVDHVLLEGPAGLGKTSLAGALAHEMGRQLWTTSGPLLGDVSVLATLLASLADRDVVFIDEIHALPRRVAEVLYEAMEDRTLSLPVVWGSRTRTLTLQLAPFTLIGATTDPDRVPPPLRARFGIQDTLEPYAPGELATILRRAADRDGLEIDADAIEALASAALGTPRQALRLWRRVRDAATAQTDPGAHVRAPITAAHVRAALEGAGIDERGLGPVHRKILGVLDERQGRPLGTQRLAALARVSARALRTTFEPELLRLGLLTVTPRGLLANQS